jgi:hypothetical protein
MRKFDFCVCTDVVRTSYGLLCDIADPCVCVMHLLTHFCDIDVILSTFTLLRNAPNLKDLEIEVHIFLCSCKISRIA